MLCRRRASSAALCLVRRQEGATLVEFALVFPVVLVVLLGGLEFFFVLFLRGVVETSLHETARQAMTGSVYGQTGDRSEILLDGMRSRLGMVLRGDQDYELSTDVYDTFQSVRGGSRLTPTASFGNAGQIVRYTLTYDYDYMTPLGMLADGLGQGIRITSSVFVRNEDF